MIQLNHVTFSYMGSDPAARTALSDVTFSVAPGEIIGVIGHTGSGKSTLMQLICGLLSPTKGEVVVCGENLTESKAPASLIRGKVGLVFQYPEHQLFEETVYRDIAFAGKNLGLTDPEIDARVKEAMKLTGLSEELSTRSPFELSGGQKRRVAIAGVLAMHPEILILDEPAAGLDPAGQKEIFDSIRKFQKKYGTTVLFVSHSMEDVIRIADRVIALNHGTLVIDGKAREVFTHAEKLRACGLDLPEICRLVSALIDGGVPIERNILTLDEAISELVHVFAEEPI